MRGPLRGETIKHLRLIDLNSKNGVDGEGITAVFLDG
uniref:Uncharacterized protein n=1 Tax=Setaria italica TaxID=4555 RepID=K4AP25_SETIT